MQEEPLLPQPKLQKLSSKQIERFARLSSYLHQVDFLSIPFKGFDKYRREEFQYEIHDVAPPEHLYFYGSDFNILNAELSVAFGGTVSPNEEAFRLAQHLASLTIKLRGTNRDAIVVSGGAFGIDMASHLGALNAKGRTVAVVTNSPIWGLNSTMPENYFIAKGIIEAKGAIVSEFDDNIIDDSLRLAARDRIVTALSDIFIVIEAKMNSGTIDTARRASIQGKKIYAVDWSKIGKKRHTPNISGFHQLTAEGIAISFPFSHVTDILDSAIANQFQEILS